MNLLLFVLIGFGITTIITKSTIFEPLRNRLDNGDDSLSENFFGLLITCPMCVGFWVGVLQSAMFGSLSYQAFFSEVFLNFENIFEYFWFFMTWVFCKVSDGAIIGGLSWVALSLITYLDKKHDYYETLDAYYQYKGESLIKQNREKQVLKD
jgi:hypothetical protein